MTGARRGPARSGRPTIADVAALAGVSRAAVSKVFNGTGSISEPTKQRVRDAAKKLNWTPSPAAVALRRSRAQTIGLVLNRSWDTYEVGSVNGALISGIESVLAPRDFGLLLYLFDRNAEEEAAFYTRLADARRVDGVLLTDSLIGDTRPGLMRSLELPAVLLGTPWRDDPIPHLDAEPPGAGIQESVRHLLELGHRRMAYIGGPEDNVSTKLRQQGFVAALAEAGTSPVAVIETNYSARVAAAKTAELLDRPDRPTAILYGTDPMAIAGMRTAQQSGLEIPRDFSVIGFDGLPFGEWTEPQLTTVQRDGLLRGRCAAQMLLEILGEEVVQEPLRAPQLIIRQSTGPAPGGLS